MHSVLLLNASAQVESTWIQGEQWLFATCARGHSVSRCSLSLLPCVTLPYYTCPTCRIPAHPAFGKPEVGPEVVNIVASRS